MPEFTSRNRTFRFGRLLVRCGLDNLNTYLVAHPIINAIPKHAEGRFIS